MSGLTQIQKEYLFYFLAIVVLFIVYHLEAPGTNDSYAVKVKKQKYRTVLKYMILILLTVVLVRYVYHGYTKETSADMIGKYNFASRNDACKLCKNYKGSDFGKRSGLSKQVQNKLANTYKDACNLCSAQCVDELEMLERLSNLKNDKSAYVKAQIDDLKEECIRLTKDAITARTRVKNLFPS